MSNKVGSYLPMLNNFKLGNEWGNDGRRRRRRQKRRNKRNLRNFKMLRRRWPCHPPGLGKVNVLALFLFSDVFCFSIHSHARNRKFIGEFCLSDIAHYFWKFQRRFQVDISPEELHNSSKSEVAVHSDVKPFVEALTKKLNERKFPLQPSSNGWWKTLSEKQKANAEFVKVGTLFSLGPVNEPKIV